MHTTLKFLNTYFFKILFLKKGKGKWVFIEKELVTLDATVCNKIGVGYTAFKNQNS